ncbi:uncharacterized protein LOC112244624 isoform X1 [Oncorhynchus tshawytscha]|nr:uncharacterized protein LOC112244624 isoform X1 [Oncorhynchus tshawytscha]
MSGVYLRRQCGGQAGGDGGSHQAGSQCPGPGLSLSGLGAGGLPPAAVPPVEAPPVHHHWPQRCLLLLPADQRHNLCIRHPGRRHLLQNHGLTGQQGVSHRVSDHTVSLLPAWCPVFLPATLQRHQVQRKANKTTPFDFDNTEAWGTDSFYVLGILGFCLYVLLGITSLPSVGAALSWREFSFVQSKLGHLTLLLCTAHGFLYGWNKFLRSSTYKWYTPPGYMLCLVLPSVVLLLKLLLITPCVDHTVTRIRQGWERGRAGG